MMRHLPRNLTIVVILTIVMPIFLTTTNSGSLDRHRPQIFAVYLHNGAQIDVSTVHMFLDGMDVTRWAVITPTRITFTPLKPLKEGVHWVSVIIDDARQGVTGEKSWSFTFSVSTEDAHISLDPLHSPTRTKFQTI